MGFGDPYHEHPLTYQRPPRRGRIASCSRCELPIISGGSYCCIRCNHWIHKWCGELPETMRHPLHDEHPLVLLAPPPLSDPCSSTASTPSSLCNGCRSPCLGGYAYYCPACQFILHLKCFRTYEHKKHEQHPLSLTDFRYFGSYCDCRVCGHRVDGLSFACLSCKFYIHFECTFIPQTVKHHHVHELTLEYDYPEESDLAYCDVCEDRDGRELDRSLSYYYCKRCDYIAHVWCVTTQPRELETVQLKHEHPLKFSQKHRILFAHGACDACGIDAGDTYYSCTQCEYAIHKSCAEFPSLIKHPLHKEHALALDEHSGSLLRCTVCEFTLQLCNALRFNHPYHKDHNLWFSNGNSLFRCNACGELGKGFRMQCQYNNYGCNFDLHLECFALPIEIEHEHHLHHLLFLFSSPTDNISQCNVCDKDMDPELWIYRCQECNYNAHLRCVASDLISTLRASIRNQRDFCFIIDYEQKKSKVETPKPPQHICAFILRSPSKHISHQKPLLFMSEARKPFVKDRDGDHHLLDSGVTALRIKGASDENVSSMIADEPPSVQDASMLEVEHSADVIHCPNCNLQIPTRASYFSIEDWKRNHGNNFEENSTITMKDRTLETSDFLTRLDEQLLDKLCCPICSLLIFPPTYSCDLCRIVFHKCCAKLPRKYTSEGEHTFALVAPPFHDNLSDCTNCELPISGYAYLCLTCEIILDVQCALGAPLMKHMNDEHRLFCWRPMQDNVKCKACGHGIDNGAFCFLCEGFCGLYLHVECALLPPIIKHRIHQHPLGLAPNLAELDDEYICDVCEKELNPNLWAYRCLESCGGYATSHVTCVVTSKKKCYFRYNEECQGMTEEQKLEFHRNAKA